MFAISFSESTSIILDAIPEALRVFITAPARVFAGLVGLFLGWKIIQALMSGGRAGIFRSVASIGLVLVALTTGPIEFISTVVGVIIFVLSAIWEALVAAFNGG